MASVIISISLHISKLSMWTVIMNPEQRKERVIMESRVWIYQLSGEEEDN